MNYILLWLLLGSLGLNFLWMFRDEEHDIADLLRGFSMIVTGPVTIAIFLYLYFTRGEK